MANRSKLIRNSFDNYRLSPISSWILGLTTGLSIAAIMALGLIFPLISILTFPLLVLPIVFSTTLQHLILKTKAQISVASSFKGFALYFTIPYRSSFRFLFSLLTSFIIFLIFEMSASFIVTMLLQLTSTNFVDAINHLYEVLYSEGFTIEEFSEVFTAYDGILFKYFCFTILPTLYIGLTFLIYNCSRNSIMIYYQMNHISINPRLSRFIYLDAVRRNRFRMLGDYLMLNWPLYVLLLAGFGVGSYLGYILGANINVIYSDILTTMVTSGFIGAAVLSSFFLPFYFSNQEVFFDKYRAEFEKSTTNVTSFMLHNIQRNIDLSNEEKEKLEKAFQDTDIPLEDKEEDKKKDPEGS